MEIIKMIMHVLDSERNIFVPSDLELEEMNEEIAPIVEAKIRKVFSSGNKKQAHFQEDGKIYTWMTLYKQEKMSFHELSVKIAEHLFEGKKQYAQFMSSDFLLCEVLHEDVRYLIGIDNANSKAMTHITRQEEDLIVNEMILYKTLFSSNIVKNDKVFIVELYPMNVQLIESPYVFETKKVNVLEKIMECEAAPSYKEAVKSLTSFVENLSEKYEMDDVQAIPKLKSVIKDSVLGDNEIRVEEVAETVFAQNKLAKEEFKEEVAKIGIKESLKVENVRPSKAERTQKIQTDNGIEIIIPVDYMGSKEIVEFINEDDGKISIRLKNINKITRK